MKLRDFYKISPKDKHPIPGSNIRRQKSPLGKFWKEILDPCCSPTDIDCTCGPRYFIQVDGLGLPVPGSLIKRYVFPKMDDGIRYMEIDWRDPCCCSVDEISSLPQTVAVDGGTETVSIVFPTPCIEGLEISAVVDTLGTAMERALDLVEDLNSQLIPPLTGRFVVNPDTSISYIGCGACSDSGINIGGTDL